MAEPTRSDQSGLRLQLRVGTFILVALAVFGGLIYGLGRQAGLFERQYRLLAAFAQVGGLVEGATVRLAGVPVGRVTAIRLPEPGDARVQVELTLVRRVQRQIRADSVARIETLGLLGDKIVEVSLGSRDAPELPEGAELRTEAPLDTAQLTKQGVDLLRNLADISADLKKAFERVSQSSIGPDLAQTVRTLRVLVAEIEQGQGVLHSLVFDRQLGSALTDAADSLRQLRQTLARLDRLLAKPETAGLVEELGHAVAEARQAAERGNRVLRRLEEGPGLLHALIFDESRLIQDLARLLARAGALVATVERGEGALGVLVRDQDAARATRRLVTAAEGLAQAVERVRETDGVLQALLLRPGGEALVADLRVAAGHFRDVTERVARGEGLIGGLTEPGTEEGVTQLAQGLAGLGRLADDLGGEGRLGETLADLRVAMANLREITARVEAGEGTLGGLLNDPTVYENLAAFLEGAQRSLLLRTLIRSAIERGENER